jgi:hypothetical protein
MFTTLVTNLAMLFILPAGFVMSCWLLSNRFKNNRNLHVYTFWMLVFGSICLLLMFTGYFPAHRFDGTQQFILIFATVYGWAAYKLNKYIRTMKKK